MESFQVLRMKDGCYYFFIKVNHGEAIVTSQRYKSEKGAYKGVGRVFENRERLSSYQLCSDGEGVFYFVLKARNGRVLGTSEMYHREDNAQKGIKAFMEPARVMPTRKRT